MARKESIGPSTLFVQRKTFTNLASPAHYRTRRSEHPILRQNNSRNVGASSFGSTVRLSRAESEIMAMIQWFGALARRVLIRDRAAFSTSSSSSSVTVSASGIGVPILCGRGDTKTKKGKRFKGSYGNARPKKDKKIERIKDKVEVPRSTPWPLPFKLI